MDIERLLVQRKQLSKALKVLDARMIDFDLDVGDRIMVKRAELEETCQTLSDEEIDFDII